MIIETHYNKTLNEMMNPNNNKLFCSTQFKEFMTIILHLCGFMADQPEKDSVLIMQEATVNTVECGDIVAT